MALNRWSDRNSKGPYNDSRDQLSLFFFYSFFLYRFVFAISRTLPLFMIISWIYSVAMIVKGKSKQVKLRQCTEC